MKEIKKSMVNSNTFSQMLTKNGKESIKHNIVTKQNEIVNIDCNSNISGRTKIEKLKDMDNFWENAFNPIKKDVSNLKSEEEFDNVSSSLRGLMKIKSGKISISNDYLKLINSEKTNDSNYFLYVESKKKSNIYKDLIPYWVDHFKKKNINIDKNKILYLDRDYIYLDNGSIISLKDDGLIIKDYSSNVSYNYILSNNQYVLNSFTLNNGSDVILKIDYSNDNFVIRDLTKENEQEQIIFDGSGRKGSGREFYKLGNLVNKVNSIELYKDDYGNESLYLSNGYLIRLGKDENKDSLKVMDRIDQLNEIAENECRLAEIAKENGEVVGAKYWNWFYDSDLHTNWCSIFISWLYAKLPGNKQFFNKQDDDGDDAKGQSGAGDVPRKSVDKEYKEIKNPIIYGDWYESEYSDVNTVPKVGDIVLFTWDEDGRYDGHDSYFSDHIGYVYKVDDEKIYTIEGNTGSDDYDYSSVMYKEYDRKSGDINGYYRPYYNK